MFVPFENYKGHIAHVVLGLALAQPFMNLKLLANQLCLFVILLFATFYQVFRLVMNQMVGSEIDIDTSIMIYAMLLRIFPEAVLFGSGVGIILSFVIVFAQQEEFGGWLIGRR